MATDWEATMASVNATMAETGDAFARFAERIRNLTELGIDEERVDGA